jgi:Transcriptional activator TraM
MNKFDAVIQDIAIKHGVVLSKDDPILILQTMNDRLIEESKQAQAVMLAQFREEIEHISSQWKTDAKEKAEKMLNISLAANKEVMNNLLKESLKESELLIKKIISDSFEDAHKKTRQNLKNNLRALGFFILALPCIYFFLMH